ncbi:MAG: hypothetical protein GF416_06825 [Candidatus Altiarchaeales archaeon]|nr:hypothetical protein [Candidatus Altiarchaeales archaeon]MBD3416826.1 hypothetical protein [Candidatus Altiarchaeales archaeon]
MTEAKIPVLESKFVRGGSRLFIGVGAILTHLFPFMRDAIDQSGVRDQYDITTREYLAVCFFMSTFILIGLGGILSFILVSGGAANPEFGPAIGVVVSGVFFVYMLGYPKSIVNKRVKYLERNLLFALRSLLIQIRSGVPIFNGIASIALGNYGPITDEFKVVVEKVNAGQPVVDVLEKLAVRNPSIYFRRAMWQVVNSMKSGSDLGQNLEDVIKSLSKEQLVEIRKYKSILNPLAMMYMMVAVIVPSLGITMLIVLSSFPGMDALGNEMTFYGLLVFVVFMQFIFLGLIKSRRPNLIGG